MNNRYFWKAARWGSLLVLCWSGLIGCGSRELIPVSGRVYLDDKPLDGGIICFHPVQGGPPGIGMIEPSGRFKMKTGQSFGVKPGEYIVTVAKKREVPSGKAGKSGTPGESVPINPYYDLPPLELVTPKIYEDPKTSPLRYRVPSNQPAEFKLSSKQ